MYIKNKHRAENMAEVLKHDEYYCSKNPLVRLLNKERIRHALFLAGDMENLRILDAGMGDGFMLKDIKSKCLYAIDISGKRCGRAIKRAPLANISLQDLHTTGFKENCFDGIICADVLEHIENPETAIAEMIRIVKKGGFIIISVPNEPVNIMLRILLLKFPIINPDHIHFISKTKLQKNTGWVLKEVYNIPAIPEKVCIHRLYRFEKR